MELDLKNKNVLITGSSRGIGFGIASAFINEGCNVLVNSRSDIDLSKFPKSDKISKSMADVTTADGIKNLQSSVKTFFNDQIDILICNVGSGTSAAAGKETFDDWQKSFNTNFFSTTNVIEALRHKVVKNSGSITCISSICGLEQLGAPLTYSAAKAALNSYVVGLSKVIGKDGIRINAVAPGNILFDGSVWDRKVKENEVAVKAMLEKDVALNKLGSVEEISNVVLFLSSPKASFVTGSIVVVDGGQVRSW